MKVISYYNRPGEFYDAARDFLYSQEVENLVIIGNTETAIMEPSKFNELFFYIVINLENRIILAAFQAKTAGNYMPLFLTPTKHLESVNELFKHLLHQNSISNIREIHSSYDVGELFAQLYNSNPNANDTSQLTKFKDERIYMTAAVYPDSLIGQGALAIASSESYNLAVSWYSKFVRDTKQYKEMNEAVITAIKQEISLAVSQRRVYFWVRDDIPVAMAVQSRETDNIVSIGSVYTPPQERAKGYATLLVAHIANYCLEELNLKLCTLITDRANPISNSVYKRIGFESTVDFVVYKTQPV